MKTFNIALAALLATFAIPQSNAAAARPTIVLVHGAFADASSWNGVIRLLKKDGYPVVAAANPLRSVTGDAKYVANIVASIKSPVVLEHASHMVMISHPQEVAKIIEQAAVVR